MSTQLTPTPLPDVIADIKENPEHGHLTVGATGTILDGVHCHAEIRQHELTIDEPMGIGGTDNGPNPVEVATAGSSSGRRTSPGTWSLPRPSIGTAPCSTSWPTPCRSSGSSRP